VAEQRDPAIEQQEIERRVGLGPPALAEQISRAALGEIDREQLVIIERQMIEQRRGTSQSQPETEERQRRPSEDSSNPVDGDAPSSLGGQYRPGGAASNRGACKASTKLPFLNKALRCKHASVAAQPRQ
jgi:hypothetical protein